MKNIAKIAQEILKKSTVTKENFIEALDDYLQDNYSDGDVKTLTSFKSEVGSEKQSKTYHLYRGVFLNDVSDVEKERLSKLKTYSSDSMSWSTDLNVAKAFAHGSNIYEKNFDLKDDQVGMMLEGTFPSDEVIVDLDYVASKEDYENLGAITENEVLVKPSKKEFKIKQVFLK